MGSAGAHTQSSTCSPCSASTRRTRLSPFRSAIAHLTSSPSVVLEFSSTKSHTQSPTNRDSCHNEGASWPLRKASVERVKGWSRSTLFQFFGICHASVLVAFDWLDSHLHTLPFLLRVCHQRHL